ncbi:LacI family DNA-binding transcriptional regulator [Flagellimonas sp. S3867]|uniref:LacI family DNA-binding transcriptional regulator n=1 Tax=Flagellimonas sp. S3867 TaxID=2768063 RepID=UPI001683C931|nr:LacI family DNA-binding transcriptional regulator [Flagellimonas sp. S3867]
MKNVTIKDVAEKLNVSISSVSRAFNNTHDIKKETRERILKTATEMGYYPNPIAQKLVRNKTYNIGVVVPEFINEYYSEVIRGVQDVLVETGYQVLIMESDNKVERELKNVKTLMQNMMDGLVICPSVKSGNLDYYLNEINTGYPIVFLNRIEQNFPAKKVLFNNAKWSFFATEHLIYQGYKRIYHLSGSNDLGITKDRTHGFIRAMEKHNFSKNNYKVIETGILSEEAMAIVQRLIDQNDLPDAFMCVNDLVALSTISVLKQNQIEVPKDIGVIGFTETKIANLVSPKLSSVKQPTFEMGKAAAEMLMKLINNEAISSDTIMLNGILNIRESSVKQKRPLHQ